MSVIIPHLVSTVIPVKNRPQLLKEAVESVLAQTYRPVEILIVDDGSTDDTLAMSQSLASAYPGTISSLKNPGVGPGPAREAGRLAARGEFIQYLDSDDLLRPRKFEWQVQALRDRPECDIAYGYISVSRPGQPPTSQPFKASGETRGELFPWILADRWWNTNAPLWRRNLTDRMGPWCDLRWSQDWEYDGRAGSLHAKLAHVKEFVTDERHLAANRNTTPADWTEPERLNSRKRFLELMFAHAETAQVPASEPCRMHFTRWVFHICRQAASTGQIAAAKSLFELAERASGGISIARKGFDLFRLSTNLLGWELAGRIWLSPLALWKKPGSLTLEQSFAKPLK